MPVPTPEQIEKICDDAAHKAMLAVEDMLDHHTYEDASWAAKGLIRDAFAEVLAAHLNEDGKG